MLDFNNQLKNVYSKILKIINDLDLLVNVYQYTEINKNYSITIALPSYDFLTSFIKKIQKNVSDERNTLIDLKIYCYHTFDAYIREYHLDNKNDIEKLCKLYDDNYKYYKLNTDQFIVVKNYETKCKVSIIDKDIFDTNTKSLQSIFIKDLTDKFVPIAEKIQHLPVEINYNDYIIVITNGPETIFEKANFKIKKNHSIKIDKYFNTINIAIIRNDFSNIYWFPSNSLILQFDFKKEDDR